LKREVEEKVIVELGEKEEVEEGKVEEPVLKRGKEKVKRKEVYVNVGETVEVFEFDLNKEGKEYLFPFGKSQLILFDYIRHTHSSQRRNKPISTGG